MPMTSKMRTYLGISGDEIWYDSAERTLSERLAYIRGMAAGFRTFAHWKDGKQLVGTTGQTLRTAVEALLDEDNRITTDHEAKMREVGL